MVMLIELPCPPFGGQKVFLPILHWPQIFKPLFIDLLFETDIAGAALVTKKKLQN
jgi:hypothetical protein